MKAIISATIAALLVIGLAGCTTPVYRKTVTTHCDGSGKVLDTTVVEEIVEPHSETPRFASPPRIDMKRIAE